MLALYKDWLIPLGKAIVRHNIHGAAYVLGDQQTFFTEKYAKSHLRRNNLLLNPNAAYVPDHVNPDLVSFQTVLAMLGIDDYCDIDLNRNARLTLDLSAPVPAQYEGVADIVLDLGTVEHIFDTGRAFSNIVSLLKPGGWVIHFSPMNWYNHGFVNFNPLLFPEFYGHNGFQLLEHAIIVTPFAEAFRFLFRTSRRSNHSPVSFYVRANKYSFRILNEMFLQIPRNIVVFVARKGSTNQPVRFPIQGLYADLQNGN